MPHVHIQHLFGCRIVCLLYHGNMIFYKENAGKWVASKGDRVVASGKALKTVMKKVEARSDKATIRFDLVPKQQLFSGANGVFVR